MEGRYIGCITPTPLQRFKTLILILVCECGKQLLHNYPLQNWCNWWVALAVNMIIKRKKKIKRCNSKSWWFLNLKSFALLSYITWLLWSRTSNLTSMTTFSFLFAVIKIDLERSQCKNRVTELNKTTTTTTTTITTTTTTAHTHTHTPQTISNHAQKRVILKLLSLRF